MNYEEYLKKIKDILDKENIKYDEEELKRVVKYALDKYKDKTILDEPTMDFVLEIAGEVATLRLDDKSIYAAILSPIADYEDYDEKELKEVAGNETVELVTTLKSTGSRPASQTTVETTSKTIVIARKHHFSV